MSDYTFYSSCWNCPATDVTRDYEKACDWAAAHEDGNPGHTAEIDDAPDEDFDMDVTAVDGGRETLHIPTEVRAAFEKSVREHGQLADGDAEEMPPGTTHQVVANERGERKVVRRRFSAI